MSESSVGVGMRLRRAERTQLGWVARCADDLVPAGHAVRRVAEVVGHLDLRGFYESIAARDGVCGRDATDPALLVSLWLYACTRGIGSARELARRSEECAPFLWLLGGVTVNHRLLSEFRTGHGAALDALFTQVIASLVDRGVVKVSRISQDGVRVRVSAGGSSFRRKERLDQLLAEAARHVQELGAQVDAGVSARRRAMRERAAQERMRRIEAAIAQLPELERRQEQAARRAGNGKSSEKVRARRPRVSTTDPEARVMKMPNGGFSPAVNVQLAADTESRAIVGVALTYEGTDSVGLSAPMRRQVERRSGQTVHQHLLDGGYLRKDDLEQAGPVELYLPPKTARSPARRGKELEPRRGDSAAILSWKRRMASQEGQQIYKQRASTSETVNADLRSHRGLTQMTVRGSAKTYCAVLWCALAYNLLHFGPALIG